MNAPRRPSPAKIAAYVKALLAAGLKPGEFEIRTEGGEVAVLTHPCAAPASSDSPETAWSEAMAKWRRSA